MFRKIIQVKKNNNIVPYIAKYPTYLQQRYVTDMRKP